MRDARVEPDVHDVGDLLVVLRLGAEQLDRIEIEPRIDAVLLDALGDRVEQLRRARMRLAGRAMREQRERHAPDALARDTPVGTIGDHVADAALAPRGHPFHLADLAQRGLAQACLLHADEPLRRRAEDHRRLVTPAMRIAVLAAFPRAAGAALLQHRDDVLVRIEHALAFEQRRARDEAPIAADRIVDRRACTSGRRRSLPGRARARCAPAPVPASSVTCSPSTTGTMRS